MLVEFPQNPSALFAPVQVEPVVLEPAAVICARALAGRSVKLTRTAKTTPARGTRVEEQEWRRVERVMLPSKRRVGCARSDGRVSDILASLESGEARYHRAQSR